MIARVVLALTSSVIFNEKLPSALTGMDTFLVPLALVSYWAYNVFTQVGILKGRLEISVSTGMVATFSSLLHASSRKKETIVGMVAVTVPPAT